MIAARSGDGWVLDGTARHVLDGDRADRLAVVTPAGVFVVAAEQVSRDACSVFDPVLHVAEVTFDASGSARTTASPMRTPTGRTTSP